MAKLNNRQKSRVFTIQHRTHRKEEFQGLEMLLSGGTHPHWVEPPLKHHPPKKKKKFSHHRDTEFFVINPSTKLMLLSAMLTVNLKLLGNTRHISLI